MNSTFGKMGTELAPQVHVAATHTHTPFTRCQDVENSAALLPPPSLFLTRRRVFSLAPNSPRPTSDAALTSRRVPLLMLSDQKTVVFKRKKATLKNQCCVKSETFRCGFIEYRKLISESFYKQSFYSLLEHICAAVYFQDIIN